MDSDGDLERRSELVPDALGLIFGHLSFEEKLTVIPLVCKSWRTVVMGPYCWQEVDIEEWSCQRPHHHVDRMVQMLITRRGSISKLCVSGLRSTLTFSLIAQNAGSLQMLRVRRSDLTDSITERLALKLQTVSILDLSYCRKISAKAIESIGNNCKLLVKFCRNANPLIIGRKFEEDEVAEAIAATMPKLKHLEMAYSSLRTRTVIQILLNCSHLEFFDLKGSGDIDLEQEQVKQMFPKVKVRGPIFSSNLDIEEWDYSSDVSDKSDFFSPEYAVSETSDFSDCDEDVNSLGDEVEMRFNEETEEENPLIVGPWAI